MHWKRIIISFNYLLVILAISSCNSSLVLFSKNKKISRELINSKILKNEFTGFALYDIDKGENIVSINSNKYFTPASNTKILTFYTSLSILKDSMPLLQYIQSGDSLIFWGTGNPLCLNPDFPDNTTALDFLILSGKKLFFCEDNFRDSRFGSGWAWDDYKYDYQLEKSAFPIYGNRLLLNFTKDTVAVTPDLFEIKTVQDSNYYERKEFSNTFTIGRFKSGKRLQIPFYSDSLTVNKLLKLATERDISKCPSAKHLREKAKTLKIKTPDTLYLRLLHDSDNFIAEQLIQMCSFTLFDSLNTAKTIEYSKEHLLSELQDKCRWVDGSGLSRYNLFSPNDMIHALKKIYNILSWEKITVFFPTAGISGTLKSSYPEIKTPFIYAKSGSLSNNYNLSGYIQTKKGNRYIFSFMNNHFLIKSKDIKQEMEKTFIYIYENL